MYTSVHVVTNLRMYMYSITMYTSLLHVHVVTNVPYRYAYVHIVQEYITMCKNVSYEHVVSNLHTGVYMYMYIRMH